MKILFACGCLAALLLLAVGSAADSLSGRVVAVFDGDTIDVLDAGARHRVRLEGIDAPESGQPYSREARQALTALCLHRQARVEGSRRDPHGRRVGRVHCEDSDAGAELLRRGLAWVYPAPGGSDPALLGLEAEARRARRGLWAEPAPVPPWEHRQAMRRGVAATRPAAEAATGEVRGNRNSKIYHLPHCASFDDISPRNRVVFASEEAALSAGYRRARNCR